MFLITPCIVRVKSISFSLYMVTQMKSSVSRAVLPMFCLNLYPLIVKSSGSQVTAVYRMCVNSISSLLGKKLYRMVGILHSRISSPLINRTSFLAICACRAPRLRSCRPRGAGPQCSLSSLLYIASVKVECESYDSKDFMLGRPSPVEGANTSSGLSPRGMVVASPRS